MELQPKYVFVYVFVYTTRCTQGSWDQNTRQWQADGLTAGKKAGDRNQ